MEWRYPLTIGLPQTNHRNFSEARLLMEAGNFLWWALGEAIAQPIARLRAEGGWPVYATIYFVEARFPRQRGLETFRLDDRLTFSVGLRSVSKFAVEARVRFDTQDRFDREQDPEAVWIPSTSPAHPWLRFGSLFAGLDAATGQLKLAMPANANLAALENLSPDESVSPIARQGRETGQLGVVPEPWAGLDLPERVELSYAIDPDRDTNATGLVYFANYIAFVESGERALVSSLIQHAPAYGGLKATARRVLWRRVAYYEHAAASDRLLILASGFQAPDSPTTIGVRTRVVRAQDRALLCLSESRIWLPAAA